jgi:rhodanese-related sulfurtransferase
VTRTISRDELKTGLEAGTITAVNLIAADVEDRAGELLPDKAAAIVTYCSNPACQNSTQVAVKLERLGYADVRKYTDGIEDWVGAGLSTESGVTTVR